jgi:membrane fusion protein (multidrug efflux system)
LELGLTIESHSAAYPALPFRGEVTHIDPRIDPVTRSVTVRALLPNPDLKLRPGMLMHVLLTSGPRQSPSIPERSLVTQQTRHFAFAVEGGSEEKVARRVPVEIGRRRPGYVEVLSGLELGQHVVADGLLGLTDGKAVVIMGDFKGPSQAYNPLTGSSESD